MTDADRARAWLDAKVPKTLRVGRGETLAAALERWEAESVAQLAALIAAVRAEAQQEMREQHRALVEQAVQAGLAYGLLPGEMKVRDIVKEAVDHVLREADASPPAGTP
jgi:flagellar biosynthesis/type III secretory pathway protein FliH